MTPGDELRRADPGLSERTDQTGIGPTMLIPSATATIETPQGPQGERRSQWQLFRRRFFRHRLAVASIVVLVVLAVLCFGAAWFAPYDPKSQDLLLGPVGPNGTHWFGTDELGR
ncbi:MAG: hypothetical protein ACXW1M_01850, partial [Acidimicrobiia bacterium]